jgi:hypothetical protein
MIGDGAWSDTIIVRTTAVVPPDPPVSLTVTGVDEKSQMYSVTAASDFLCALSILFHCLFSRCLYSVQWKPGKSYGADILGYQLVWLFVTAVYLMRIRSLYNWSKIGER